MSNHIRVACPHCREKLDLPPDHLGRERICERCRQAFTPAIADPGRSSSADKVVVQCPGCHRHLRIRPKYLGTAVACNYCSRPFIPALGPAESTPIEAPGLGDRIARLENRLDQFDRIRPDREASSERIASELTRIAGEIGRDRESSAGLREALDALRGDFEGHKRATESRWVAGQLSLAGESAALVEEARDESRRELERIRGDLDPIRRQNVELERIQVEAQGRASDLGSRLASIEEALREGADREARIEQALAGREAGRIEQDRELASGLEGVKSGLSALRDEVDRLGDRQDRAEREGSDRERDLATLREGSEAALRPIREELGRIRDQLASSREADRDRSGLRAQLDEALARLATERAGDDRAFEAHREELDGLRDRQELAEREDRDRAETLRSELEALRAGPGWRSDRPAASPSGVVDGSADRPDRGPVPPGVRLRPPVDLAAQDLALDLIHRGGPGGGGRPGPRTTASVPSGPPPAPGPGASIEAADFPAEYQRLGGRFSSSTRDRAWPEAVSLARQLAELTRTHQGELSSEHALWLRNLGMTLPWVGDLAGALSMVHRAREICRKVLGPGHSSFATCLIDQADLYLISGDIPRARASCEEALAILRRTVGAGHPLLARAQACLDLIEARRPSRREDFGSTTIMTT